MGKSQELKSENPGDSTGRNSPNGFGSKAPCGVYKGMEKHTTPEHLKQFNDLLDDLTRCFGTLPLLVPSEPGMKGSYFKWGKLTKKLIEADTAYSKDYWKRIGGSVDAGGNLCVKLGTESDDLVTIDLDADELVEP